jgi:hypothetical protein
MFEWKRMGASCVGGVVLSVPFLEDGSDGFVGARVEQKGTGTSGVDAL